MVSRGGSGDARLVSIRVSSYLSNAMTRLDRRDYEAVLSFLEEAHAVEEPVPFTPHLLDRLAALAHCELATFFEFAPGTNSITVYVPCSDEDSTWRTADDPWWTCTRTVELRRRKAQTTAPIVLADVFPRRLRVEPDFNRNYGEAGVVDEMSVSLDRHSPWTAEVAVFRMREFGERERSIFQLLQPHLTALYRAANLRRRRAAATDASCLLTRREREVMTQVEQGLPNAEIARVLVIEPSTVRKHLEHIFEKLGVSSRTAAVAKLRLAPRPPRE
jgi:DNA-binding CsgD family transcriptional regulator